MEDKISNIRKSAQDMESDLRKQTLGYILTALGLVAGLAWNEAITSLIKSFFPLDENGVLPKFIYAIVITVVIVLVSRSLMRMFARGDK